VDLPSLRKTDIYWAPATIGSARPNAPARPIDLLRLRCRQAFNSVMRIGLDGRNDTEVFAPRTDRNQGHRPVTRREDVVRHHRSRFLSGSSRCTLLLLPLDGGSARKSLRVRELHGRRGGSRLDTEQQVHSLCVKESKMILLELPADFSCGRSGSETVYRRNGLTYGMAFHRTAARSRSPAASARRTPPTPGSWST